MSDIRSTLENTPVYLRGKNALPKNFIEDGLVLSPNGLSIDISTGTCDINGKFYAIEQTLNQAIPPRSTGLVYAQDTAYSETPLLGFQPAVFPAADNYTIGRWIIDGSAYIPNSAVGANGNTTAVANDLVRTGTVKQVDGHIGYAGKGDGLTGHYSSVNSTGFPIGSSERELGMYVIANASGVNQKLASYGVIGNGFVLGIGTNNAIDLYANGTIYNTGYLIRTGEMYFISACYDGTTLSVLVNGNRIFTVDIALNTTVSILYIFKNVPSGTALYSPSTILLVELRNKVRTIEQLSQISNRLLLPRSYITQQASYPVIADSDLTSAYHEYKFDDTSGTTVIDTAGNLNGTATGTSIVSSAIGLGKARKFNGSNSYISFGPYAFPLEFTVIIVANHDNDSQYLLDNRSPDNAIGNEIAIVRAQGGRFVLTTANGNTYVANTPSPIGKTAFHAVSIKAGQLDLYVDSPNIDASFIGVIPQTGSSPMFFGIKNGASIAYFSGDLEYLLIIPRGLSQAEIAQYYNSLMKDVKKDIREVIPSDAISLGRVATSSSAVEEIKYDHKYGRREKAFGGNRKQFLGFQPFNGGQSLSWTNNPYDSTKVRLTYTWAQDSNGSNELPIVPRTTSASSLSVVYGYLHTPLTSNVTNIMTYADGVVFFNGVWQTSGYIGCYAEVIE